MTTKIKKAELTVADIVAAYDDPEWQGYGYLGAIAHRAADTEAIARANAALIDRANQFGWDRARLWTFLNSKAGRWYGEDASGLSGYLGDLGPRSMVVGIDAKGDYKGAAK